MAQDIVTISEYGKDPVVIGYPHDNNMVVIQPTLSEPGPEPPMGGMISWWKADSLSASDDDTIEVWEDSSGNNYHITQSTAGSRPIYKTNQINSKPALRFEDKYFDVPNIFSGVTAAEIFGIVKVDLDPPVNSSRTGLWQFGGTGERMHFPWTTGTVFDNFCTNDRKTTGNPTPSLTDWRLYSAGSSASYWSSSIDGTSFYSTTTNTTAFTGNRFVGLSRESVGTDYYLWGYIAEIILYDHILTLEERSLVKEYFAEKYDLTIS